MCSSVDHAWATEPAVSQQQRVVVRSVAASEVIRHEMGGAEVEVLGDVHGIVIASGGGARVIIHGDVHPGAQVGARGGCATVEIRGRVR